MNIGAGGVVTGMPGSIRTPRWMSSIAEGPTDSITEFPSARLINDRSTPFWIEKIVFQPVIGGENPLLKMGAGGIDWNLEPVRVDLLFDAQSSQLLANKRNWMLTKAFPLMPGEVLHAETDGGEDSVFTAMGYYESMCPKLEIRHIPYILQDEVEIPANSQGQLREEALRNDGEVNYIIRAFQLDANIAVKITGSGSDWMNKKILAPRLVARTGSGGGRPQLLVDAILRPSENLTVIGNNTTGGAETLRFMTRGYRVFAV